MQSDWLARGVTAAATERWKLDRGDRSCCWPGWWRNKKEEKSNNAVVVEWFKVHSAAFKGLAVNRLLFIEVGRSRPGQSNLDLQFSV